MLASTRALYAPLTHAKLSNAHGPRYTPGEIGGGNIWVVPTSCCGRVGVLICADTFKSDILQAMTSLKPDLVLVPYGWSGTLSQVG